MAGRWELSTQNTIYAKRSDGRRLHRVIVESQSGVDHKDGCGLDNRRINLRPANKIQNGQNGAPHRDGSSEYKGVCWDKARARWRAEIYVEGRKIFIGRFHDEVEAAKAYDEAARKNFGEFARLNFP